VFGDAEWRMEADMPTAPDRNVPGWISGGCFFAIIFADMVYGGIKGRESLVTWVQILLGALALFSLFSHRITEFAISKTGVTIKQRIEAATEAAAALGAAAASRAALGAVPDTAAAETKSAAQVVAKAIVPRLAHRLEKATVLWVDDKPDNNRYERQAMEALGIQFVLSTTTEDALTKSRERRFDAIISDMGRPSDPQAGYTLLEALRGRGDQTPFIIYTGRTSPEKDAEARKKGALGITARPDELLQLVLSAVGNRQGKRSPA
jgi:CheY-like chemotaxis protein